MHYKINIFSIWKTFIRFQGWPRPICFPQLEVRGHWIVAGKLFILTSQYLVWYFWIWTLTSRLFYLTGEIWYFVWQCLNYWWSWICQATGWRNMGQAQGCKSFYPLIFWYAIERYDLLNENVFLQAEKAAFEEAEKKREEEVKFCPEIASLKIFLFIKFSYTSISWTLFQESKDDPVDSDVRKTIDSWNFWSIISYTDSDEVNVLYRLMRKRKMLMKLAMTPMLNQRRKLEKTPRKRVYM